jgi:hypothetical protein
MKPFVIVTCMTLVLLGAMDLGLRPWVWVS